MAVSHGKTNLDYLSGYSRSLSLRNYFLLDGILVGILALNTHPAEWKNAVDESIQRLQKLYPEAANEAEPQKAGAA